jgi:periplasmic protein TonB
MRLPAAAQQRLNRLTQRMGTGYLKLGKTHLQRMLVLSAAVHALVIVVRFVPDDALRRWDKEALMVVLVNAQGDTPASQAQALANANLLGGGDADSGMVQSPLPNMGAVQDGDELAVLQKQVTVLEREQASLIAALKGSTDLKAPTGNALKFNPKAGTSSDTANAPLMREVAALDKQIQDYSSRPKRKFLSPATREVGFAAYYALWSDRTERLGTEYYPEAARGKSAQVLVTVSVRSDGSLDEIIIHNGGSGNKAIDRGAMLLLKKLAPYPKFSPSLKAQVDILDITTRLIFTPAGTLTAQMMASPTAPAAGGPTAAQPPAPPAAAPTTPAPTQARPARP